MEKIFKLNTSIKFLDSIFNVTSAQIFVKDKEHRFVKVNRSFCSFVGRSEEDIIGKVLDESFPKEERDHFWKIDQKVLETGIENVSEEVLTVQGHERNIITTKNLFIDEQGERYIVGVFHDITERKKFELDLQKKNEELVRLSAEKDKFFSVIAHDLRSPFSGFIGLFEIMSTEFNEMTLGQIQEMIAAMRKSASNLYDLLENLLEWSKLKMNMYSFDAMLVLLKPKVEENINVFSENIKKKGIEISLEDIDLNLMVIIDEDMFKSIIHNLVANAIKFTPNYGAIQISAKTEMNNFVEISISDNGIGMPPEMVENLFNIEVQTNRRGTNGEATSGLGLMLCKEFIERHGGNLRIVSEEGKGSTFSFTVPCRI